MLPMIFGFYEERPAFRDQKSLSLWFYVKLSVSDNWGTELSFQKQKCLLGG